MTTTAAEWMEALASLDMTMEGSEALAEAIRRIISLEQSLSIVRASSLYREGR